METHASITIQAAFNRAVLLAKRSDENFIELGRLLRRLQDEDAALFRLAYVEAGIGRRTAYSFAQIARAFEGLPVTDAQLAAIGSTRALLIAPVVDTDNCAAWIERAACCSTRDLRIIVEGGEPIPGSKPVLVYLPPQDHARFIDALLAHGGFTDGGRLYDKEKALMNIVEAAEAAKS